MTPIPLSTPESTGLASTFGQFPTNVATANAMLTSANAALTAAQAALAASPDGAGLQAAVTAAQAAVTAATARVAAATNGAALLAAIQTALNGAGVFTFASGQAAANIMALNFQVDCNGNVNLKVITAPTS